MPEMLTLLVDRIDTPIGELVLAADEAGKIRALDWTDYDPRMVQLLTRYYGKNRFQLVPARDPHGLREPLGRYFAGDIHAIDDLPVETTGTPFQRSVWKELRNIRGGKPISYGTLAGRIQRPKAVRAVGLANGSNPVGLIVPCHRVIGSDGSLTGYGGGLHRKQWLLDHEAKHSASAAGQVA
jgi:methylated-DNA-[protein]-cysteine S-methyltransferase